MLAGELFPVLAGSAGRLIGMDVLADFLKVFAPTPARSSRPSPFRG